MILQSLDGPEVPEPWRGAGAFTYRAGPGQTVVRLRVRTDDRVRPVWTVTGLIRGSEQPDDVVIVGNHRDAWVYGGVDPSSGSAALIELARVLGDADATTDGGRDDRFSSPAGMRKSSRSRRRPSGASSTRRGCARARSPT